MLHIAVLDDYQRVAAELADWSSIADAQVQFFHDTVQEADALVQRLNPFEVLVTMRERTRFPASVLERLPDLRLISGTGRAQSHVDLAAATRLGIIVCGTGGDASGASTAELTWALILACVRHLSWEDRQLRHGGWQTTVGRGLEGMTLGILGLGRIGTRVAHIGQAFGMRVIAWGPTLTPERAAQHGVTYVSWESLFADADVVTIHVRLSDMSRGWVTVRELEMMKPTAYLVNTARSAIIDQVALLEALRQGKIAGAGLDVYDQEPLPPGHPLLSLDNVVLTPHLGYVTREALAQFYRGAIENVRAWRAGAPANVQNPEVASKR
jgi:phosphoglycerate dehydrogenase-like enzyme